MILLVGMLMHGGMHDHPRQTKLGGYRKQNDEEKPMAHNAMIGDKP